MPDVVGLREAVDEQEGWAIAALDSVDGDLWGGGNSEVFETWEHHCY